MRIGTNEGDGHYQCLYSENNEWYVHDPMMFSSDIKVTTRGHLNSDGRNIWLKQRQIGE